MAKLNQLQLLEATFDLDIEPYCRSIGIMAMNKQEQGCRRLECACRGRLFLAIFCSKKRDVLTAYILEVSEAATSLNNCLENSLNSCELILNSSKPIALKN